MEELDERVLVAARARMLVRDALANALHLQPEVTAWRVQASREAADLAVRVFVDDQVVSVYWDGRPLLTVERAALEGDAFFRDVIGCVVDPYAADRGESDAGDLP